MATKAVHLELVSDLTTKSFLSTLQRFVSRRGLCSSIFSDNATNFVSANNELKRLSQLTNNATFQNYLSENQISWHFIPSRSPHFGGIWEAAVRSSKHFLKRVAFNIHFSYEEFHTLLCRIEAILNSRPLCPLNNDPEELEVLTPGHFIIGSSMQAMPQNNIQMEKMALLSRYELLQKLTLEFWNKWSKDYLNTLQQRSKWKSNTNSNPQLGELVLLKEDSVPPQCWPLGRIVRLHPGSDDIVRVITIKTAKGECRRAVNRVVVLPVAAI